MDWCAVDMHCRYRTIFLKLLPQGLVFMTYLKVKNQKFEQKFKKIDFSKLKNKSADNKFNSFSMY